jgi:rhodanese-related sulfurtransferase
MRQLAAAHAALIIDARPEIFYRVGHIPTAISLPRDDFEARYRELVPKLQNYRDQPVVVYCSSNECEDSQMVAEALQRLGLTQVHLFRGGWSEWESENLPEETP